MSRILFDHIAIAMTRIDDAAPFLMGELGGVPDHGSPSGVYRFGQWRFLGGGRIEILEPLGEDGFLHRFLRERGPGIHHVTFKVPSLGDVCDRARARGYTIVGYDDSDPRWKEAFLHPKQALGIVVQFVESRSSPSLRRWQPPPGPANPRPPVTVLGLRMRARSRERALTQWGLVLEGECVQETAGALVYRWPGSPMRLTVEIDPASDEGPLAVELASDRPVSLPEGPHPLLGALFTRRAG